MTKTNQSTNSRQFLLTASKTEQYLKCPRSVVDVQDLKRGVKDGNSAGAIGSKLHSALESMTDCFVLTQDPDAAMEAGENTAKQLGVWPEWQALKINTDVLIGQDDWQTEKSLAMTITGGAELVDGYEKLPDGAFLAGTADFISLNGHIIGDWKTGTEKVEAKDNKQLLTLAKMYRAKYNVIPELVIVGPGNEIDRWKPTAQELDAFDIMLESRPFGPFESAGQHCFYCPLKPSCKAFMEEVVKNGFQQSVRIAEEEP